jgi:hypothetical protein
MRHQQSALWVGLNENIISNQGDKPEVSEQKSTDKTKVYNTGWMHMCPLPLYQPEASSILMVASMAYTSNLTTQPSHSSEIPVNFHQATWHHIPEDSHFTSLSLQFLNRWTLGNAVNPCTVHFGDDLLLHWFPYRNNNTFPIF